MSHLIPFRPIVMLLAIMITYGGIHWKKVAVLLPWTIKTILLEPFRWMEAIYVALRSPTRANQSPVFVLGFYRSGTTWLQELMSCDPEYCTPTIFQTIFPEVMLTLEFPMKAILQWLCLLFRVENPYHRLPFRWDFPGEDDVAINALANASDFNRIFQYPSHADQILMNHFRSPDPRTRRKWGQAHKYFSCKLQLANPGMRMVLKSPPNTGRVALLKSIYPGAQFIFIKRDQKTCLRSTMRIWDINRAFSFEPYSKEYVEKVIRDMYDAFHEVYNQEKRILKAGELVEVAYEELISKPTHTLDRIYEELSLVNNDLKRQLREQLIHQRSDYQPINHQV